VKQIKEGNVVTFSVSMLSLNIQQATVKSSNDSSAIIVKLHCGFIIGGLFFLFAKVFTIIRWRVTDASPTTISYHALSLSLSFSLSRMFQPGTFVVN